MVCNASNALLKAQAIFDNEEYAEAGAFGVLAP
jgi:hypothetical protein